MNGRISDASHIQTRPQLFIEFKLVFNKKWKLKKPKNAILQRDKMKNL